MDIDFQSSIDMQLYCCKFYNKEIEVKHPYLLFTPGQKDTTTFRINFDQTTEVLGGERGLVVRALHL